MERREAPGACETPSGFPCDREACAPRTFGLCDKPARPVVRLGLRGPARGARASSDGVAKPAAETLRLPALHRDPSGHVCRTDRKGSFFGTPYCCLLPSNNTKDYKSTIGRCQATSGVGTRAQPISAS